MPLATEHGAAEPDVADTFRRLYYHLYGNGGASRAERILSDLYLLLMLKAATERHGEPPAVRRFRQRGGDPRVLLLPTVRRHFPRFVARGVTFSLDEPSLRTAVDALADLDLSTAPVHVVGEAFQTLMGPRLRGDRGQFFTPRRLVAAMVAIVAPKIGESVLDPACGTGGFLAQVVALRDRRRRARDGLVAGVDKDADMAGLATALLGLTGAEHVDVRHADALAASTAKALLELAGGGFDTIVTNPPFGARIGVRDPEVLAAFELGRRWTEAKGDWIATEEPVAAQDPQVLFLELCVRLLRPGGRMGIVLPEGLFGNARHGYLWAWLRRQGHIEAMLDCPRTTFQPGTDTKTNVLFFRKERRRRGSTTRVAVANHCGHDRRGRARRTDGRPYPDDLSLLGRAYHESGEGWNAVDLQRRTYLVPRYYAAPPPWSEHERLLIAGAPLRTLASLVRDGSISIRKGNEVGAEAYGTGSVPFVRTSDLSNYEIRVDSTLRVSEDVFDRFRESQRLAAGMLLLVADGRYRIGEAALLTEHDLPCVVQSHLRIIEVLDHSRIHPEELLFALTLDGVQQRLRRLVFVQSTLATVGRRLAELEIPLLHGPGPWRPVVDRFNEILRGRRALLGELASIVSRRTGQSSVGLS